MATTRIIQCSGTQQPQDREEVAPQRAVGSWYCRQRSEGRACGRGNEGVVVHDDAVLLAQGCTKSIAQRVVNEGW